MQTGQLIAALAIITAGGLIPVAIGRYRGFPASISTVVVGVIAGTVTTTWLDLQGQNDTWIVYLLSAFVIVIEIIVIAYSGRGPNKPPRG